MIAVEFKFLTGRYHATQWGRNVNEGFVDWPPSPWRIIRAIISAWKINKPEYDLWPTLKSMVSCTPSFFLPQGSKHHTRHYVPLGTINKEKQSLKKEKMLDSFMLLEKNSSMQVAWSCSLSDEQVNMLGDVVSTIRYIGRAESWCETKLAKPRTDFNCVPDDGRDGQWDLIQVLVPDSDATFEDLTVTQRLMDSKKRRYPPKSSHARYLIRNGTVLATSNTVSSPLSAPVNVIRYAVIPGIYKTRPHVRETLWAADRFKRRVMQEYSKNTDGGVSENISGKNQNGSVKRDNHKHAYYLPMDDNDDGFIDSLTVVSETAFTPQELKAMKAVKHVYGSGGQNSIDYSLAYTMHGGMEAFDIPILAKAKRWRSVTPYVMNRHTKTKAGGRVVDGPNDQILAEITKRGMPQPVVELYGPTTRMMGTRSAGTYNDSHGKFQAISFKRHRKNSLAGFGAYAICLEFGTEVRGPVSLGHGSHYGLGLCIPERV